MKLSTFVAPRPDGFAYLPRGETLARQTARGLAAALQESESEFLVEELARDTVELFHEGMSAAERVQLERGVESTRASVFELTLGGDNPSLATLAAGAMLGAPGISVAVVLQRLQAAVDGDNENFDLKEESLEATRLEHLSGDSRELLTATTSQLEVAFRQSGLSADEIPSALFLSGALFPPNRL